ncbi:hypothetical protein PFMG_02844 [Plasmodium falciparum IGH-CR14]|uniref:General transcription factor IIH subunit 2 n=1 Tax=Plasmodium falciparum IGH-CR14 TaxID=580059 RepID=A0A0L1IBZ6_PLAFA|nr:hypothetical protein PFMG_02844 [Plasmodium falciparum IGH-CR14]
MNMTYSNMHMIIDIKRIKYVERSWNLLVENNGVLQHVSQENNENENKEKYRKNQGSSLRKGIFRHIIILFDMSSSMKERDLKPDRINVALECVEVIRFIKIKRNNK